MPRLLLLFLLMLPIALQAQQTPLTFEGYESDEGPKPATALVRPNLARVTLDGKSVPLGATEHELACNRRMTLHVHDLQPHSTIRVDLQKTGVKVETKRYTANHVGELILEFTTPRKPIGATAKVHYVAANGTPVELKTRVKFR